MEEVNLVQAALGRILGFGRIDVHGTGDDLVPIPAIADPLQFRQSIQDALAQAKGRKPG